MTNDFDTIWNEAPEAAPKFLEGKFDIKNDDLLGNAVQITGVELSPRAVFKNGELVGWSEDEEQAVFQFRLVSEVEDWGDEAPYHKASYTSVRMLNFAKMLMAKQANYLNYLNGDEFEVTSYTEAGEAQVDAVFPLPVCFLSYDVKAKPGAGMSYPFKWVGNNEANAQELAAFRERLAQEAVQAAQEKLERSRKPTAPTGAGSVAQRAGQAVNRSPQGRAIPTPKKAPTSRPRTPAVHA